MAERRDATGADVIRGLVPSRIGDGARTDEPVTRRAEWFDLLADVNPLDEFEPPRLAGACCRNYYRQTGIQTVTTQLATLPSPPAAGNLEVTRGVSDAGPAAAAVADAAVRAKTRAAPTARVRRMTFFGQFVCVFIRIPCTSLRHTVALSAAHTAVADERITCP